LPSVRSISSLNAWTSPPLALPIMASLRACFSAMTLFMMYCFKASAPIVLLGFVPLGLPPFLPFIRGCSGLPAIGLKTEKTGIRFPWGQLAQRLGRVGSSICLLPLRETCRLS
jgi:hypothetical protein